MSNAQYDQIVPLAIGITGHRDIDPQDDELTGLLRRELKDLREKYPEQPFVVVSPLAEGADRLMALTAMEILEAKLIVPLPLPLDDPASYKMDFHDTVSDFERLLARADAVFEGPLRSRGRKWRDYNAARNRQYAWVGAYVVEHCPVLFALWDGEPARGIGGTAHVVKWFLDSRVPKAHSTRLLRPCGPLPITTPELLIHINPETGEVRHHNVVSPGK